MVLLKKLIYMPFILVTNCEIVLYCILIDTSCWFLYHFIFYLDRAILTKSCQVLWRIANLIRLQVTREKEIFPFAARNSTIRKTKLIANRYWIGVLIFDLTALMWQLHLDYFYLKISPEDDKLFCFLAWIYDGHSIDGYIHLKTFLACNLSQKFFYKYNF